MSVLKVRNAADTAWITIGGGVEVIQQDAEPASMFPGMLWLDTDAVGNLRKIAMYSHTLASGTAGGTQTASAWNTSPINTEDYDPNGIGSLSANRITLEAGTYKVTWSDHHYKGGQWYGRLQNITSAVTLARSVQSEAQDGDNISMQAMGFGIFTVAASQALELQYYTKNTQATNGLGAALSTGDNEIYRKILFERIG